MWVYCMDGFKFTTTSRLVSKYGGSYGRDDTIGCGINMQSGRIFFTKNGVNLGKD